MVTTQRGVTGPFCYDDPLNWPCAGTGALLLPAGSTTAATALAPGSPSATTAAGFVAATPGTSPSPGSASTPTPSTAAPGSTLAAAAGTPGSSPSPGSSQSPAASGSLSPSGPSSVPATSSVPGVRSAQPAAFLQQALRLACITTTSGTFLSACIQVSSRTQARACHATALYTMCVDRTQLVSPSSATLAFTTLPKH